MVPVGKVFMEEQRKRVGRYDLITPMIPCKDEILAKIEKCIMTGNYILGEEVQLVSTRLEWPRARVPFS